MGGKGGKGGWVGRWRRQSRGGNIYNMSSKKISSDNKFGIVIVRTCRLYYRVTSSPVMICDCS